MQIVFSFVLPLVLAALASWWALHLLIPWLSRRLLDQPNARSSHSQPTPRGGGLVLVGVGGVGMLLMGSWLPLLCLPLALVGFLDDRRDLPASLRFGVQLSTAVLLLLLSPLVPLSLATVPLLLLLAVAITAVINFTNFMDGLDGLVAICLAVAFAAVALASPLGWPLWPLVGSLLGFLVWNWSPARVFMGDVGSTFLGALFAAVVLQASSWQDALARLLLLTPLLADAGLCVPRRLLVGQPILQAHRLHLFQRLHQAGWSHAQVAALYGGACALLAGVYLARQSGWMVALALAQLVLGCVLDRCVAVSFSVASDGMAHHDVR